MSEIKEAHDLLQGAFALLANVRGGDWTKETPYWQEGVAEWRRQFFAWQARRVAPDDAATYMDEHEISGGAAGNTDD